MTSPLIKRTGRERFWAWLVTGPVGHLYSVTLDMAVFWLGQILHRRTQLVPGSGDQADEPKGYNVVSSPGTDAGEQRRP
jgi:hypothetical protein